MIDFIKTSADELQNIIDGYRNRPLAISNYYGLELHEDIDYYKNETTLLLRLTKNGFCRIYLLSTQVDGVAELLSQLDKRYAINIPSRGELSQDWRAVISNSKWDKLGVYSRYFYKTVRSRKAYTPQYAELSDLDAIENILYSNFSKILGRLPMKEELKQSILDQQIVVNRDAEGVVSGLMMFSFKKKTCYLDAWMDKDGRGLPLLYSVFNIINEREMKYTYMWVNNNNVEVIKLHQMLGAKADGLTDHTYIKS